MLPVITLQWKLYGTKLLVESKLTLKNCWMWSIDPVLHSGLILLQTEFHNKHSSTVWDPKRTIHTLAVAFIRTWEVLPWHSIDFRSYFTHSEQLVAAFERTHKQLAGESPQDEATFGCLRCKPALKSVSKCQDALWKHTAEWSGKNKAWKHISPCLCDEGTSPFSDLHGNSSCGSFACLSSHNAKISCPGIVLLQLWKMNGNPRPHMRNIGKKRSSKPHSLTFPPSQFTHVWRIRSCDPNQSISPEVPRSELSGPKKCSKFPALNRNHNRDDFRRPIRRSIRKTPSSGSCPLRMWSYCNACTTNLFIPGDKKLLVTTDIWVSELLQRHCLENKHDCRIKTIILRAVTWDQGTSEAGWVVPWTVNGLAKCLIDSTTAVICSIHVWNCNSISQFLLQSTMAVFTASFAKHDFQKDT